MANYERAEVVIRSRDYWVKVVEMLQQNWALIDCNASGAASDVSTVFDQMAFQSEEQAVEALRRNGFRNFARDKQLQSFLTVPKPPFRAGRHPNGPIYSSGRFWK